MSCTCYGTGTSDAWPMLARCWTRQWAGLPLEARLWVEAAWDGGYAPVPARPAREAEEQAIWWVTYESFGMILMSVKDG